MSFKHSHKSIAAVGVTCALALNCVLSPIVYASPRTDSLQAELDEASKKSAVYRKQAESAFAQLQECQAGLEGINTSMESVEKDIRTSQEKLDEAQSKLAQVAASSYKTETGGNDLIKLILGSSSIDELVNNIFYANKIAETRANQVADVRAIQSELAEQKQELEAKQAEQLELLADAESAAQEMQAAQQEHASYVNGLSGELQAALAAEEAARAEAEAQQQAQQNQSAGGPPAPAPTPTPTPSLPAPEAPNKPSFTPPQGGYGTGVQGAINAAKSQLGVAYSWGMLAIPGQEFDCAGLTWWAYGQAGISIPHGQSMSNGRYSSQIGLALDGGSWTTNQAELKPGDLMFWGTDINHTTHVAMCIGGGQMIHANYGGVEITSIYYGANRFVGGGSII